MSRPHVHRSRLRMEALEDRCTPAAAFADGRVLVTLADPAAGAAALAASPAAAGVEALGFGVYEIDLAPGLDVAAGVSAFAALPGVAFAEPDYALGVTAVPNDPSFGTQYAMNNTGQSGGRVDADIDAPEAWDVARGTGDKIVAVIDSGVDYTHPDLAANMWRNPGEVAGNGIDDDRNGIVDDVFGADFANNDGNPMDDNNHGTHVAGTIGAVGNNGIGVAGVAWTTRIMAVKFLGADGSGATSNAVRAINYAVANGADILNNSWGGGGFSSTLQTAIRSASNAGVIFVAAAGNNATNTDTSPNYPSGYDVPNVVSVAATDRNDNLASYSNFGAATVDLGAPGSSILSTVPGGYAMFSGTSMATPHVSGALAVLWDANPTLTAQQVIAKLYSSLDPLPSLAGKTVTGGRLNLQKLLSDVSPPVPPSPPPPPAADTTGPKVVSAGFEGSAGGFDRVRFTFSEPIATTGSGAFTLADVSSIGGPAGAVTATAVTAVSGTNNTVFLVTFPARTTAGTYTATIGPDVRDAAGNQLDQNGDGTPDTYTATGSIAPATRQTFGGTTSAPIRDFTTTRVSLTVPTVGTVADVTASVTLTHTFVKDLVITLTSPSGKVITLFNRRGGSGDNLTGTTFDDAAATAISAGRAPFSGSYRPEQALSGFDGLAGNGTWTLSVTDQGRGDIGTITRFTVGIVFASGGQAVTALGVEDEPAVAAPPVADKPVFTRVARPAPAAFTRVAPAASPAPVRVPALFLAPTDDDNRFAAIVVG
ncbi:S8 family serine peptidase [bacterium]|nr:S8 family serine peptidase [bacterium]